MTHLCAPLPYWICPWLWVEYWVLLHAKCTIIVDIPASLYYSHTDKHTRIYTCTAMVCSSCPDLASSLCHESDSGCHLSIIGSPLLQELGLHLSNVGLMVELSLFQLPLKRTYLLFLATLLLLSKHFMVSWCCMLYQCTCCEWKLAQIRPLSSMVGVLDILWM